MYPRLEKNEGQNVWKHRILAWRVLNEYKGFCFPVTSQRHLTMAITATEQKSTLKSAAPDWSPDCWWMIVLVEVGCSFYMVHVTALVWFGLCQCAWALAMRYIWPDL